MTEMSLHVQEWGGASCNKISAKDFSGDGNLIVVVPGHTSVPPAGLQLLRDELHSLLPEATILVASTQNMHPGNETALQEDDIDFAAVRLAQEVTTKLDMLESSTGQLFSLSFWCLGTGGLIARASLAWLTSCKDRCCAYVSLGTPHLGLFLPGLSWLHWWRIQLWRSCFSGPLWLDQLMHMEGRRARGSRLSRLCDTGNLLGYFDHVIFIGTGTDLLVPLSSSVLRDANRDAKINASPICVPDTNHAAPTSKILLVFFPILWLVRLRAWSSLVAIIFVFTAALLLPSPPGHIGRRLDAVKMHCRDLFTTVRGQVEPELERDFAHKLLSSISEEKLLKVEVWPNRRNWRFAHFGSDLLCRHKWIKTMVERYGRCLIKMHVLACPRCAA